MMDESMNFPFSSPGDASPSGGAGRLHIAMLSVHSCPLGEPGASDTGGMSVYLCETARELGRRGHRVDVYTRAHGPGHERVKDLGRGARLIHITAGENGRLDKLDLYPLLDDFFHGLEAFRGRAGVNYDLVYSHYWLSGCVGQRASAAWSAPHAVMFHTLGAVKNALGPAQSDPELRLARERDLIADCDLVVVPTERERMEVVGRYDGDPGKTTVIPCGVNLDLFRPNDRHEARQRIGLDGDDPLILYVGRMDPVKGIDRLLAAGARLKSNMDFYLWVVGGDDAPGTEQRRLAALARRLGLRDTVTFTGRVPQKELPFFYNAADVFVLPSYYESFGMVALESLACGTPVVSTDVGGLKGILIENETGCVAGDGRAVTLAEKISGLLPRALKNGRESMNARATVTGYSWSRVVDRLLEAFDRLMGERAAPPEVSLPPEILPDILKHKESTGS